MSVIVCGLSGCGETAAGWQHRYGPQPMLSETAISSSVNSQQVIMNKLREIAFEGAGATPMDNPYYLTMLAGFNYIDEQCDAYLRELFVLDQERDRLKKGIDSAGLLTNLGLAASSVSKNTMAIATQAFGLTSQYADTVANSYLYGADSGTIFGVVSKLQAAYRDQAEADKLRINSTPIAYARIRGYLQLCMPPTIESKIDEALASGKGVAGAEATGEKGGSGTAMQTRLIPGAGL
ncbi:hypothetical protein [Rhizobium sp. ARZ01]|uniref:hypothetical protein n=1 Tax=Rhizobium sp. ARZ01 TaxID=2769313 RepID=UPI001782225B|nr:hypothetical protein [Rhizobium sp. ARZ01]